MDEEEINEDDESNELYRDVNFNLEGRDTEMTNAPRTIIQTTQVIEDTHVIITPVNPEAQQQSSSMSYGFVFNMLNPSPNTSIDFIFNLNTELTLLIDVPVTTIAEPPLLDEAQAENADFINKLDDNIKKIIKDHVKEQVKAQVSKILLKIEKTVNEQLEAEVLTRSSNKSKTPHAVAANLSKKKLKKILIDKMERKKSIHISDEQKNLYKVLVDAYESDKLILDTYGETVSFKRGRDEEDKDEEPFPGSNRGSKRRRARKEPKSTSAPKEKTSKTTGKLTKGSKSHHKSHQAEEPIQTDKDLEEPAHQEFKIRVTKDQPDKETSQLPDWFQKPAKPPTPNHDWNKTLLDAQGFFQPWLSSLAQIEDPRESFNEIIDTPLDFSAFVINRLKVDTLTPKLLAGPTFKLMKGSSKSLVKLEYFFEEVYKATTDQLDWNNHEGQQYPHDLRKPLPLIPNSQGRRVIPFDHFINNDLAYLSVEWLNYKHLDWITVRRDDDKLYTFKEGDFNRLRIQDIEDMLLLLILGKLTNLTLEERLAFNVDPHGFKGYLKMERNVALENEKDSLDRKVIDLQSLVSAKDLELKDLNVVVSSLKSQNDGLVDQVHTLEATCYGLRD
ncbi:hypothetical protein Tco_0503466, partial [Tanacetum coccineum]